MSFGIDDAVRQAQLWRSEKEAGPQDQLVLERSPGAEGKHAIGQIRTALQARLRSEKLVERGARWMAEIARCVMKNPPLAAPMRGKVLRRWLRCRVF